MKWFGRKSGEQEEPGGTGDDVRELMNPYHHRASVTDGDRMMIDPSQVLENIAEAMERVDNDINTPISIEDDVASEAELASMITMMQMGPLLATHVANTALKIMSARYPKELVRHPLPPGYDLRQIVPLNLSDRDHEIAKTIFNQRTASNADLEPEDVAAQIEPLDAEGQLQVFICLFYMYGTKVGAMKNRTGIE